MKLHDDLGVTENASTDEIKKAYRRNAQRHHPDKPGGNAEKFHAIQVAYDVLTDPERRARYEKSGKVESEQDRKNAVMGELARLFMALVDREDCDHTDIVARMRESIRAGQKQLRQKIEELRERVKRRNRVLTRIKKRSVGEDPLGVALRASIRNDERQIQGTKDEIEMGDEMLKLLADYNYTTDKPTAEHRLSRLDFEYR